MRAQRRGKVCTELSFLGMPTLNFSSFYRVRRRIYRAVRARGSASPDNDELVNFTF